MNNISEMAKIDKLLLLAEKQQENSIITEQKITLLTNGFAGLKKSVEDNTLAIGSIEDRMAEYEETVPVTRNQANTLRAAIHKRTKDLLNIQYDRDGRVIESCIYDDVHYRGKMISRLYACARKESVLGTPYYATYKKDYVAVLDYINNWAPVEGVKGFKEYCDEREAAKRLKAS